MRNVWFRSVIVLIVVLNLSAGMVQAAPPRQEVTPTTPIVVATVAVERAVVLPFPDRAAEPLLYLYEREQVPVIGQSADGVFLYVPVDHLYGWVVAAQFDVTGDLATMPVLEDNSPLPSPTVTITPFGAGDGATAEPGVFPTRTPLPTRTPGANAADPALTPQPTGTAGDLAGQILPGEPPPITITLPETWQTGHLIVPYQTFDGAVHDVPLSIYTGDFAADAKGILYVYWGFPNTVDWVKYNVTGEYEYNLWSDGVQLLRGSLVGKSCNLGLYDQQQFTVGALDGIGAYYQAADCGGDEKDTAGWFVVVQVLGGSFAFYTAFEPWTMREDYQADMQAILDSVTFLPPEE